MGKKAVITVVVLIAVAFIGYKGKSLLNERKKEIESVSMPLAQKIYLKLATPKNSSIENKTPFLATVEAKRSVKLSTKLAGFIKEVSVEESQFVKKGENLVKIDERDILSNIKSLKSNLNTQIADLDIAKKIYNRNKKLYKAGALPKEKLELSSLSLKAKSSAITTTKQKIAQLNNQLSYLNIKAPFDATVDAILMHKGDLAVTGKPIIALSTKDKKLIIAYSTNAKSKPKKGDIVYFKNEKIGYVKTIYSTAKNGLEIAEVKLEKNLNYPSGSSINVTVQTAKATGCEVPQNAIIHTSNGNYVMEYKDNHFIKTKVDTILENSNVAILKSCPKSKIAVANETTLAILTSYKNVVVLGDNNASK